MFVEISLFSVFAELSAVVSWKQSIALRQADSRAHTRKWRRGNCRSETSTANRKTKFGNDFYFSFYFFLVSTDANKRLFISITFAFCYSISEWNFCLRWGLIVFCFVLYPGRETFSKSPFFPPLSFCSFLRCHWTLGCSVTLRQDWKYIHFDVWDDLRPLYDSQRDPSSDPDSIKINR